MEMRRAPATLGGFEKQSMEIKAAGELLENGKVAVRRHAAPHRLLLSPSVAYRTPGPFPPVASMNSTPACSSARRHLWTVPCFGSVFSSSKSRMVGAGTSEALASSSRDHPTRARAALS
jgi:hypothetical protein